MFERCHTNSRPLSSPSLWALRPPSGRRAPQPCAAGHGLRSLMLFVPALSLYFRPFFVSRQLRSKPELFSSAMPRGSVWHRFVWRLAAAWHIVPTVLIRCQAPFHLHFTPLSHSVCLCHSLFTPAGRWQRRENTQIREAP